MGSEWSVDVEQGRRSLGLGRQSKAPHADYVTPPRCVLRSVWWCCLANFSGVVLTWKEQPTTAWGGLGGRCVWVDLEQGSGIACTAVKLANATELWCPVGVAVPLANITVPRMGYPLEMFVNPEAISRALLCSICHELPVDPKQCRSGKYSDSNNI